MLKSESGADKERRGWMATGKVSADEPDGVCSDFGVLTIEVLVIDYGMERNCPSFERFERKQRMVD